MLTEGRTVNNLAGPEKRAPGIAFMVTMGNTGAFVGKLPLEHEPGTPQPQALISPELFLTNLTKQAAGSSSTTSRRHIQRASAAA
jgi:hypothetical protein